MADAKRIAKLIVSGVAVAFVAPLIITERLARLAVKRDVFFVAHGELLSLLPGKTGYFLRNAYYRFTLRRCSTDSQISFGTYFSNCSKAEVGTDVYIGTRCLIGIATIGDRVLIADHVQILSGSRQHASMDSTRADQASKFTRVHIGNDTWIGTGAIIMADIGEHCVVGAGSVVTKPIPDFSVAVGNPAKVIRSRSEEAMQADLATASPSALKVTS